MTDGSPPFSGAYRPLGSLAPLVGQNPNGNWKLVVSDIAADGNVGTLVDWSLDITMSQAEPSTTTDADGRYLFAFGGSGTHLIREIPQDGYVPTAAPEGFEVTASVGTPIVDLDFGNNEPAVVGRYLFYNQSKFDGNNPAIGAADDAAIATDKVAYLADTGLATFANVSSYYRGINGVMVDLAGGGNPLTADDFVFRIGTDNDPANWQLAPPPSAVSVRPGAGAGGSDRIEITWENGAIKQTWLEITVKGNDARGGFNLNTTLPASDVFYFGNRIGDAGNDGPIAAVTNATDEIAARVNPGFLVGITNRYDYNRDSLVNAFDQIIARVNGGLLLMLDLAPRRAPQPAPTAAPTAGVASALAMVASGSPQLFSARPVEHVLPPVAMPERGSRSATQHAPPAPARADALFESLADDETEFGWQGDLLADLAESV